MKKKKTRTAQALLCYEFLIAQEGAINEVLKKFLEISSSEISEEVFFQRPGTALEKIWTEVRLDFCKRKKFMDITEELFGHLQKKYPKINKEGFIKNPSDFLEAGLLEEIRFKMDSLECMV